MSDLTVIVLVVCGTVVALGAIAGLVVVGWRYATCMYAISLQAQKTARNATDAAVTPEHAQVDRVHGNPEPVVQPAFDPMTTPMVDGVNRYERQMFGNGIDADWSQPDEVPVGGVN